jgi:hypothetical protein
MVKGVVHGILRVAFMACLYAVAVQAAEKTPAHLYIHKTLSAAMEPEDILGAQPPVTKYSEKYGGRCSISIRLQAEQASDPIAWLRTQLSNPFWDTTPPKKIILPGGAVLYYIKGLSERYYVQSSEHRWAIVGDDSIQLIMLNEDYVRGIGQCQTWVQYLNETLLPSIPWQVKNVSAGIGGAQQRDIDAAVAANEAKQREAEERENGACSLREYERCSREYSMCNSRCSVFGKAPGFVSLYCPPGCTVSYSLCKDGAAARCP